MKLPETAKQIPNTINCWADINGDIYCISNANHMKNQLIKKKLYKNKRNGYLYVGLSFEKGYKTVRVHRQIALTFLEKPEHYDIVGHKDNDKTNNHISNLYWTNISENTQKAFDDGLIKNDKGFDDTQSKPVTEYDSFTHEKIKTYGSIIEASKETGIPKTTIARQAKHKRPVRRVTYFRYVGDHSKAEFDGKYNKL